MKGVLVQEMGSGHPPKKERLVEVFGGDFQVKISPSNH